MNYYELRFTYQSPIETEILNDVLAAELGEIGFESFTQDEQGLQGYISDQLYDEAELKAALPLSLWKRQRFTMFVHRWRVRTGMRNGRRTTSSLFGSAMTA